jgi:RNA polymerase sigma-70 factor (ECF subfamily)
MNSRDAEWIRSTLDQYEKPLTRYAVHITGDLERARDVVQDTFLKLCSRKPSQIRGYLAQWLYTVCRNRALDVRRKERRMTSISQARLDRDADPESSPSSSLERNELLGLALRVLESLPENQREVLRLKFQGELSYREISQITRLSVTNVGFLIHTGIKAIREELQARSETTALRRVK